MVLFYLRVCIKRFIMTYWLFDADTSIVDGLFLFLLY